jgi:hypothetical protein
MGMFDDLIPTKTSGGMFDDLIPAKPTPQQIEAMGAAGLEAERKAAEKPAIITKAPMPSTAKIEAAKEKQLKETIPFEELYKNPELFSVVKDYMKVSRNIEPEKGQSDEDFVKKYMATMRDVEFNTFTGALPELNRIRNAKPEDAETLGLGRELYKQTRSVMQPGGQGYGSADALVPYWNALTSIATDPLSYLGFGAGKLGSQVVKVSAAKEAAQLASGAAAKGKLASILTPTKGKVVAGVAGLEATSGVGQSVVSQRLDQEVAKTIGQEPEELSAPQMILSGVVSGLFGGLEAKAAVTKFGKTGKEQLADLLKKSKEKTPTDPTAPSTKVETALLSPVDENMDLLAEEFMKQEGAKVLDQISPAAALVEPAIRRDLSQRAIRVALNVIENDPTYKVKAGQKTSTAIAEVFSAMDQGLIDDTLLEQAIRKEGLSPEQFAQANRVTVTQAAQIMQQYSTASKALNRLRQIDPDVAKQVDALYGSPDEYTSTLGYLGGAFNRLERESKALIVSGIGTTVRNIMGSGIGLTFNSAASVIEGSLMTIGKTLSPEAKGARFNTLKTSIGDTIENAFGTWGYLRKNDLASEVTDELLKHNPSIRSHILSAMQESDTDLSKVARMANALNVAQDAFFRKAIFANSVEKKLKGVGLDMYELIADGKVIPADILKEAADDTLKATFSYTPKIPKGGIKTFEGGAEAMGNYFVKAAEVPGGSLFVTFPRFMTNAIAFQYRYSPLGGIAGAEDILRGSKMLANGDEAGASLIRKGQENTAKGIVGTAALLSAIDYRENNQDVEWNLWKRDDGTTVDMRGIFPIGPLLAMADVSVKHKRGLSAKTGDALEAVLGMKMPAGTQNQFMDQLISALSSEKDVEKWADKMGKVVGDFGARFVSPFIVKDIFNMVDMIREGGSVARDPNVIKSEKPVDRILEAAGNRIQSKLPVLKEELPETIPRVRQGPIYKEGEFFNNLVGIRITPEKTPEETELVYLGIEAYKLFGQPSGDKEYDRAYVEEANPLVIASIQRAMLSPRYQALPEIEQKKAIENVVKNILPVARQLTDAKFMNEDLVRVYKMKFNKLPEDTRKIINNRYANENNGKTLEETNDYMRVPEYAAKIKDLQFAKGGVVAGKVFKAGAKAAATGTEGMLNLIRKVKNPEAIVANEINNVVEDALNKADLTTKAIPTTPVVKEGAASAMKKIPYDKNKYATPVSKPAEDIPMDVEGANKLPDLQAAQKPAALDADMEKLVDEAEASFTPTTKEDDFWNAEPVNPKATPDKDPEFKIDEVEYDEEGYPIEPGSKPTPPTRSLVEKRVTISNIPEGNLNAKVGTGGTSVKTRKAMLAKIREERQDSFESLIAMPEVSKLPDAEDVMAVVQGDFRYTTGREINLNSAEDMQKAAEMAKQYQDRLNRLREEYKDVPPIKLFHGRSEHKAGPSLRWKTGFDDPQFHGNTHSEMYVGGTSFTRDINLNFENKDFGGTNPEKIVYTKIPYADYMFSKVPMSYKQYNIQDFNTIARSINGSERVVRPVSMSRSGSFREAEDMITETDKLRPQGKASGRQLEVLSAAEEAKKAMEGVPLVEEGKTPMFSKARTQSVGFTERTEKERAIALNLFEANSIFTNPKTTEKERIFAANQAYKNIKDYFNNALEYGSITSTKEGIGQRYHNFLRDTSDNIRADNYPANYPNTSLAGMRRQVYTGKLLENTAEVLKANGSKEKAKLLLDLKKELDKFEYSYDLKKQINAVDNVRNLTRKFNKGGLASRR